MEAALLALKWNRGERALLAVSGGPDSVALLFASHRALSPLGVEILAAHYNHGLRPEADDEQALASAHCDALGVRLYVERAEGLANRGKGIETAARDARLAFLEDTCARLGAVCCLTAHHMDDQAETVLMHMFRGAGTHGMRGIPARRGVFSRPFLRIRKRQLVEYCEQNGLEFATDASNAVADNPRNAIRNVVLPLVLALYPGAVEGIARAALAAAESGEALDALAEEALASQSGDALSADSLRRWPPAVRKRALTKWLSDRGGSPEAVHLNALDEWIAGGRESGAIDIPGARAVMRCGRLRVTCQQPPAVWRFWTEQPPDDFDARTTAADGVYVQIADAAALPPDAVFRPLAAGDRMRPLGAPGTRLVSDVLTDKKMPRPERKALYALALNAHVLWIPGVAADESLRMTQATERAVLLKASRVNGG